MTDAEEMVRKAVTEFWHLVQYGDEDMLRALNDLNPDFGNAVIGAATSAALAYAQKITEVCAQLADDAICPRAAATAIRRRFQVPRPPPPSGITVADRLGRGDRWCPRCLAWHTLGDR